MSLKGIENEIKWIKRELNRLKGGIEMINNNDLMDQFKLVEGRVEDLEIEYRETISNVKSL